MRKLDENGKAEMVGQIIDLFEDHLEEKLHTEKAVITGDEYNKLAQAVRETLENWGILSKEGEVIER